LAAGRDAARRDGVSEGIVAGPASAALAWTDAGPGRVRLVAVVASAAWGASALPRWLTALLAARPCRTPDATRVARALPGLLGEGEEQRGKDELIDYALFCLFCRRREKDTCGAVTATIVCVC
jgi:hypothetical protein